MLLSTSCELRPLRELRAPVQATTFSLLDQSFKRSSVRLDGPHRANLNTSRCKLSITGLEMLKVSLVLVLARRGGDHV